MRKIVPFHYAALFLCGLSLLTPGCSTRPHSPQDIGYAVVEALKNNDVEAYLQLCGTTNDIIHAIQASSLSTEQKNREIKKANEDALQGKMENRRRKNFKKIAGCTDWSKVEVDNVLLGKIRYENGAMYYKKISVVFVDNALPDLDIDTIFQTSEGWKIMDDYALSL